MTLRARVAALLALATVACSAGADNRDIRQWTDDLAFRISSNPVPPRAREQTVYKVIVRDKNTGQPLEGGEGRIFASTRDGAQTWDPLLPGPELGTYYGTLRYVTAGEWAVAIEFRRDSTKKLERMDWMQEVRSAAEPTN